MKYLSNFLVIGRSTSIVPNEVKKDTGESACDNKSFLLHVQRLKACNPSKPLIRQSLNQFIKTRLSLASVIRRVSFIFSVEDTNDCWVKLVFNTQTTGTQH